MAQTFAAPAEFILPPGLSDFYQEALMAAHQEEMRLQQLQYQQPISIYKYFQVDGLEIGENWLKPFSRNVVEYRAKLYSAMQIAQQRYLERKNERRVHLQRENLVPLTAKEEFLTVYPKQQSLALEKRRLLKESRGGMRGRVLERYFVVDDQFITFFHSKGDVDFQKNAQLDGAFVFVEDQHDHSHFSAHLDEEHYFQWHDSQCQFRVQIGLPARQLTPVFFYTNDLNLAKTLAARVYLSSTQKRSQISEAIRKLSFFEGIFRFQQIWRLIFKVYEKRLLKMISFQILGINLNELANTVWLQREKLFRFWSGQVLKRHKIPLLRSTFRYGQIKKQLDPSLYRSSLMVREQLLKLVRSCKNRRLQRHAAIQADLQSLLEDEESGSATTKLVIKIFNDSESVAEVKFREANVKVESQKFITVQSLDGVFTGGVNFYEQNPPIKLSLDNISCIATDFNPFDKKKQVDEFTVRVYGRVTQEYRQQEPLPEKNLTPEELGLDILRKQSSQTNKLYEIKIHAIELPISFAKRFSLKADLRVKLRQGRFPEQLDRSFFLNSRPYRLSVPHGKEKGRMVLKGGDFTFIVDKLDSNNPEEQFKISVVLQRSNVPVTQFMKEFLHEEEFISDKSFSYAEATDLEIKCSDPEGNKMKVKFSISEAKAGETLPAERDGLRLLVGRYVIYQKRIAYVCSINRDNTIDLQNLSTGTVKQNVKMKNVKMIEHGGVNVWDLRDLPAAVANCSYQWVMEFRSRSKRLVNIIQSGIQNKQVSSSFALRSYSRDKKRDIEGHILFAIQETLELRIPQQKASDLNLFVRVTILDIEKQNDKEEEKGNAESSVFETPIVSGMTQPIWTNEQRPNGYILNIGNFFKEEIKTIKFELVNKLQKNTDLQPTIRKFLPLEQHAFAQDQSQQEEINKEEIIGSLEMKSIDFIDIENPGQERCLALEKDSVYSFLIIQSLFVATNVTRIEYQLMQDHSIFFSPDQHFHFKYLQKQWEIDSFRFAVPTSRYHPNHLEKLATYSQQGKNPIILLDVTTQQPDRRSSPLIALQKGMLCSLEEKYSVMLRQKQILRPQIEEGILIFKYLWKQRVFQSRQQTFNEIQNHYWLRFLTELGMIANQKPFVLEIRDDMFLSDGDVALLDLEDKSYLLRNNLHDDQHIPGEQIFEWIKKKANIQEETTLVTELQPQALPQYELKPFPLMFDRIWIDDTSQVYADTYYLIQAGIPASLRVRIWKDLLRLDLLEFEEMSVLKRKQQLIGRDKSVYQNYKDLAGRQDCLAFRQIDEDIEQYQFPRLYSENEQLRVGLLREERRKMRSILRVLVLWSRNKKIDGQIVSFSYTQGLMHIIQRLLTIADEEDAFWLLNGIVRMIPRLFSTDVSCLTGGRISVMRNEMTAFKAILRENLPVICDKLRLLGLPVDYLIYESLTSFYAHFFSSEVVLRLWDLIIFNLANKDKIAKKRALWYFMAPAYWILRERQQDILAATTIQQVVDIYHNGCAITYNPDWIVNDLKNLIKEIFVTNKVVGSNEQQQQPQQNQSKLSFQFNKLLNRVTKNEEKAGINDKAQNLEETRKQYEADLSLIFNSIEEENKQIAQLLEKSNFKSSKGAMTKPGGRGGSAASAQPQQFLDYNRWRMHVMARFKKVALKKQGELIVDDLYVFEEAAQRNDLDLSKVNIYLHKLLHLTGIHRMFRIRLYYGTIADDGSFQVVEERFNDEEMYSGNKVEKFYELEYLAGYNHIKVEVVEGQDNNDLHGQVICDMIIDLHELSANRFIKKHNQLRCESLIENPDSYRMPTPVFVVSFFLQTHTKQQLALFMQKRNATMSQFINSIKRKLPDRIDIFNKQSENEFVTVMKRDFRRIIAEELSALECFLPSEIAQNTINDQFNYTEEDGSDFGNISLPNLQYLVKQCFFSEWVPLMEGIYKIFVKGPANVISLNEGSRHKIQEELKEANDENPDNIREETNKITYNDTQENIKPAITTDEAFRNLIGQAKVQAGPIKEETNLNYSFQQQDEKIVEKEDFAVTVRKTQQNQLPFSLRNFLVTLVLMSHCTIHEKFDILYDLFDWNDGVADGLDLGSMFLLIKTIFERNLYYWPSHELFNLVESSFDLSVSGVYHATWTNAKDFQQLSNKKIGKLQDLLSNPTIVNGDQAISIDVTSEIQETLNSYQRMFGNKIVDFNYDSSAFKSISTLIKNGQQMLDITNKVGQQPFKLTIYYQISSERYLFDVPYDRQGLLIRQNDMAEKDDIDEYLKRNINKLYLTGRSKGISKQEFMSKTQSIPFLHDLVRVETLYRDRYQSSLQKKKKLNKELVVLVNEDEYLFIFRFQSKVMANVEGDVQKLDSHTYRVLMMDAYEQDVVSDIRERIVNTLKQMVGSDKTLAESINGKFITQVQGVNDFFVRENSAQEQQHKWRVVKEFDRLVQFASINSRESLRGSLVDEQSTEIILKIEQSKHQDKEMLNLKEEERDLAGFDCYSLYKHCDLSYEWRLCKIMQKELIVPINQQLQHDQMMALKNQKLDPNNAYLYWIEFLHNRKQGQKLWFRRKREEILMSARYVREQQRNYEQETLKFVRESYREAFQGKQ